VFFVFVPDYVVYLKKRFRKIVGVAQQREGFSANSVGVQALAAR
jgi:hypothetical protein